MTKLLFFDASQEFDDHTSAPKQSETMRGQHWYYKEKIPMKRGPATFVCFIMLLTILGFANSHYYYNFYGIYS